MNKEAALYRYMKTGKPVTHWEAIKRWRLLDFRKAITRIRRKETVCSRWCVRDGVRYREHWLSISTNTKARA